VTAQGPPAVRAYKAGGGGVTLQWMG
jgi:hypothetical protein